MGGGGRGDLVEGSDVGGRSTADGGGGVEGIWGRGVM